jgi:hypothetical protein
VTERYDDSGPASTLPDVVATGDRRASLTAIRDRLAAEADDTTWASHKRECSCVCGMGDGRTLVAIVKELRVVLAELDALPGGERGSAVDDLAARRAARLADAAGS